PGEARMALARAMRLDPKASDGTAARAAWDSICLALLSRLKIVILCERRGGRLGLDAACRAGAAFADLLTGFAAKTTDMHVDMRPAGGAAAAGAFALDAIADGLHPFALEDLDREMEAPFGRVDARAELRLLSLLQEHHLTLTAMLLSPEQRPALVIDE